MTGFCEFALPALRRLSGLDEATCRPILRVPLASRVTSKGDRVRFVLARLLWGDDGPCAEPVASRSSADLVAGGRADGVIAVAPGTREVEAGTVVDFLENDRQITQAVFVLFDQSAYDVFDQVRSEVLRCRQEPDS